MKNQNILGVLKEISLVLTHIEGSLAVLETVAHAEYPELFESSNSVLYEAGNTTTKPGTFFYAVKQQVAEKPLSLATIIANLKAIQLRQVKAGQRPLVPKSVKIQPGCNSIEESRAKVIEIRTRYAAAHGHLVPISR
jgi:hypothetical protein